MASVSVFVFAFICLCLLLYTHLYCIPSDQLSEPLAGSEGLNPSTFDHGFLCRQSVFTTSAIAAMITLAIIIVSGSSSLTRASRGTTGEEFEFGEELHQCFSMSDFSDATLKFSENNILYKGDYRIYIGIHLSTSRAPYPYTPHNNTLCLSHLSHPSTSYSLSHIIVYKGKYLTNDRYKLEHLSHLSHPNLAPMLGYSCNARETVVGYKNEGARLLIQQLSCNYISWCDRLNICIGVAEALGCLHTARIFHGGISPTTVLVDHRSFSKLVTFGFGLSHLPRHISRSTRPTEKGDVYLFGLLLLIIFCGNTTVYLDGNQFRLPNKVGKAIKDKTLHEITDLTLAEIREKSLCEFLAIAFHCVNPEQGDRPSISMDEVLQGLKEAQTSQIMRFL